MKIADFCHYNKMGTNTHRKSQVPRNLTLGDVVSQEEKYTV